MNKQNTDPVRINLKDMRVDMSYQRNVNPAYVKKIAKEWDDMKANLVHVSLRADGFYYVMDGNHTRLAAEIAGRETLPCRVYVGLTTEDEARNFATLNASHKKPTFAESLKARAAAGYELEKSYLELLEECGISYTFSSSNYGLKIKCHSALLHVYRRTNRITMLRALSVAKRAADGRPDFYQIGFFPGLCDLVVRHPDIDDQRLIDQVKKTTSSKLREIADKYKRGTTVGGGEGLTTYYRNAYIEIYNKGLRNGRIITGTK